VGVGSGIFFGYSYLMWYPDPYRFEHKGVVVPFKSDVMYVLRGMKAPVMWGALGCATFSVTECLVESMRDEEKKSTWVNAGVAGAVTGALLGTMSKRFDVMASSALGVGMIMSMVEFNGQTFQNKSYHIQQNWIPSIPAGEKESDEVKGLKSKYPEFKDL
jgi:Tim17/Tim22/Tim23/Pmp24 family